MDYNKTSNAFAWYFFISSFLVNVVMGQYITENETVLNKNKEQFEHSNAHVCNTNENMPWCIPDDYQKYVEPWNYHEENNLSLPWKYEFTFDIFDIQEINDRKQTVTIMMYFRLKWMEPRLKIDPAAPGWNNPSFGISVSPYLLRYLWYPDIEIYGLESFGSKRVLKEMADIQIFNNSFIKYNARVDTTISCHLNFENYPMDTQYCPFQIGSYYATDDLVTCSSAYSYLEERQRSLQYSIQIEELPEKYRKFQYRKNHAFDTCGFNLLFSRTRTQYVFQVYLTSAMFVVVSWVSFIINPEVVPGRIGLLVTIFLVLVNIFNRVQSKAPVSMSLNAVDLYLIVSIGHVFLALSEYAIVLFLAKHKKGTKPGTREYAAPRKNFKRTSKRSTESKENMYWKLDEISLIIFPFCFTVFNIAYIGHYM